MGQYSINLTGQKINYLTRNTLVIVERIILTHSKILSSLTYFPCVFEGGDLFDFGANLNKNGANGTGRTSKRSKEYHFTKTMHLMNKLQKNYNMKKIGTKPNKLLGGGGESAIHQVVIRMRSDRLIRLDDNKSVESCQPA